MDKYETLEKICKTDSWIQYSPYEGDTMYIFSAAVYSAWSEHSQSDRVSNIDKDLTCKLAFKLANRWAITIQSMMRDQCSKNKDKPSQYECDCIEWLRKFKANHIHHSGLQKAAEMILCRDFKLLH